MKVYYFKDESMTDTIYNDKGKILRYVHVYALGNDETEARNTSGVDEKYSLVKTYAVGTGYV